MFSGVPHMDMLRELFTQVCYRRYNANVFTLFCSKRRSLVPHTVIQKVNHSSIMCFILGWWMEKSGSEITRYKSCKSVNNFSNVVDVYFHLPRIRLQMMVLR